VPLPPAAEAAARELRAQIGEATPARWRFFEIREVISLPPQVIGWRCPAF
jgi:hypothetical protein